MNLISFDLYGNEKTNKHGYITYEGIYFDGKNGLMLSKRPKENTIDKIGLTEIINTADFSICHNFYGYDGVKLPGINNHFKGKIDTLLIDCLFSFSKKNYKLKKSNNNNTLEDAFSAQKIFKKNFDKFNSLDDILKETIYSILINEDEYTSFFDFYSQITKISFSVLTEEQILENIKWLLLKHKIFSEKALNIIKNNLNHKLCIAYIILFIHYRQTVFPEFISKKHTTHFQILSNILTPLYREFSIELHKKTPSFLNNIFGFDDFKSEEQRNGVNYGMNNKDILLTLSTGGGKSLIYQLPACLLGEELGELSIIISPLKALIKDQIDGLLRKGFRGVNCLTGDQCAIEQEIIQSEIVSGKIKILFIPPEKLRNDSFLQLLKNRYVGRFIIDEAHTLILWGQEFRPDYYFIKDFIQDLEENNLNKHINITLLTATATFDIENRLINYFNKKGINKKDISKKDIKLIKSPKILKENILKYVYKYKDENDKNEKILDIIHKIDIKKHPTIIFVSKKKTAEILCKLLCDNCYNAEFFHAELFSFYKKQIQEKFISGELNLIIATKAFGLGIDKTDIRYVIHYDLPEDIEEYIQEIGRGGRDGNIAKNIIFYNEKYFKDKIEQAKKPIIFLPNIMNFLRKVKMGQNKGKIIISPRNIAKMSFINTKDKHWDTKVTYLINFIEDIEIGQEKLINRKYNKTLIHFDTIKKKITTDNYKRIEQEKNLTKDEKTITKIIVKKVIEEKKSIDLNYLEKNLKDELGDNFDYRKIKTKKIIQVLQKLKIFKNSGNRDIPTNTMVVQLQLWTRDTNNYNLDKLFAGYAKRVKNIVNFKETENCNMLYLLQNYYLEKGLIYIKSRKITIKNKKELQNHFKTYSIIGKSILEFIYQQKFHWNKQIIYLDELFSYIQENYDKNYTMFELKQVLVFLHTLNILQINSGLIIFLERFEIYFYNNVLVKIKQAIIEHRNTSKNNFESREEIDNAYELEKLYIELESKIKRLLERSVIEKEIKILALQKTIKMLIKEGNTETPYREFTQLTEYYFKNSLYNFCKKYLIDEVDEKKLEKLFSS